MGSAPVLIRELGSKRLQVDKPGHESQSRNRVGENRNLVAIGRVDKWRGDNGLRRLQPVPPREPATQSPQSLPVGATLAWRPEGASPPFSPLELSTPGPRQSRHSQTRPKAPA